MDRAGVAEESGQGAPGALSGAALTLLGALPRQCELLFPGMKDQPLSDMSLTAVLRRMRRTDIPIHGFRSTFRDWCAEAAGNAFTRESVRACVGP